MTDQTSRPDQSQNVPSTDLAEDQKSRTGEAQTPVSDEQQPETGSGTHGRPSDDSDPGHS